MSILPEDLRFTPSHEWVRVEEDIIVVGITDYAQTLLGELVYVELPDVGDIINQDEDCAVVESVKAASDVYCPVAGEIIEINDDLEDEPNLVNDDPYGNGWLFKLHMDKPEQLDDLMTAEEYQKQVADEAH
ncbi:MAG: glycine cleavage system protein GcvH [Gammaproteobacteria bacterium]|nr:glycine cleavage system protein GcvH [Gammaproteobacteria bacterium]